MAVVRKMGISDSLIYAWRKSNDKGKRKPIGISSKKSRRFVNNCGKPRWSDRRPARDPKKSCCHFQSRRGTATNLTLTYQFTRAEEPNFPVRLLCKVLNVSKSAYYAYRTGNMFTPSVRDLAMTTVIDKIFWENSRRYGSRRVMESLKGQGLKAGRHRVRRLMHDQDWRAI